MPIFAIENVTTHVSRERRGGVVREMRTLEVEGPAGDGGRNRARFVFGAAESVPTVGYLTRCAAGVTLTGWLPAAAYGAFRDALAAGGPLQVHYETREGQAGYLRRLGLGRAGAALIAAVGRRPGVSTAPAFAMPH